MKYFILLFFCCLSAKTLIAQRYLQIEKINSTKLHRLGEGSLISYKLKEKGSMWKTEEISRIIPENNIIITPNGMVKISDIDKVRFERYWTKAYQASTYTFGAGWLFWNGVGILLKEEKFTKSDLIIVGAAFGSGFLVRKLFKYKVFNTNARHRLRLIDLNFRDDRKFK
jgi:hypothetical protein